MTRQRVITWWNAVPYMCPLPYQRKQLLLHGSTAYPVLCIHLFDYVMNIYLCTMDSLSTVLFNKLHQQRLHLPLFPTPPWGLGGGSKVGNTNTGGIDMYPIELLYKIVSRPDNKKTICLPHPSPPSRLHVYPPHPPLPFPPRGSGGGRKVGNVNTGVIDM